MSSSVSCRTEIFIEQITDKGFGVGFFKGKKVFVDGALPNENVCVALGCEHETYFDCTLLKILKPNPDRVSDFCCHPQCGGCQFRNISYDALLRLKSQRLSDALCQCRDFIDPSCVFPCPCSASDPVFRYRNKSIYYVRRVDGVNKIGMFAKKSHILVSVDDCAMEPEWISSVNKIVLEWMSLFSIEGYDELRKTGLIKEIIYRTGNRTGDRMVILVVSEYDVIGLDRLSAHLAEMSVDSLYLNINSSTGNAVYGEQFRLIYGKQYITTELNSMRFMLGPRSFWQLNSSQCERLYAQVKRYAKMSGTETVFDLYCGVGSIGLSLAHDAGSVYGVEIIEEAVELAKKNAEINNITNSSFFVGNSEIVCQQLLSKGITPDLIILDPPRKGCAEELLKSVISVLPERIIYVSCCPESLARDLSYMGKNSDYRVSDIAAFDLFPGTTHVESVVKLTRAGL